VVVALGVGIKAFIGTFTAPIPVTIENEIAERKVKVSSLYTVGVVADTINSAVCNIVEDHPGIKGVNISVIMDEPAKDKYGNKFQFTMYMGSVEVQDIQEVKKYNSCSDYSYANKPYTIAKVMTMKGAGSLRK